MPFQRGRTKTGGRRKGTLNKQVAIRQQALAEALAPLLEEGRLLDEQLRHIQPLDVLLLVMRKRLINKDWQGAVDAALAAAPYMHPKLNAAEVRVQHTVGERSDDAIAAEIEMLRLKIAAAKTIDVTPMVTDETNSLISTITDVG
jgi:hypothetical protein